MSFTPYSAKNAKVRYGASSSSVLTVKGWDVQIEAAELDVTHMESAGYHEAIAGIRKMSVTINCDDDGAANLFDAGWTAGANLTGVRLYLNGTSGPYWALTTFFLRSPQQRADVQQTMSNTFTGVASGTFTYPTGNAGSTS